MLVFSSICGEACRGGWPPGNGCRLRRMLSGACHRGHLLGLSLALMACSSNEPTAPDGESGGTSSNAGTGASSAGGRAGGGGTSGGAGQPSAGGAAAGGATTVSFERDVAPIFADSCVYCHYTGSILVDIAQPFTPGSGLVDSLNSWATDHPEGNTPARNV